MMIQNNNMKMKTLHIKQLILILTMIFGIICFTGCSNSDEKIIDNVKNSCIDNFSDKMIGTTLNNYFKGYNADWSVLHTKGTDTYDVEYNIDCADKPVNIDIIGTDTSFELNVFKITFEYNTSENMVSNVSIYGYSFADKKNLYTNNLEESKVLLYTIFDERPSTWD